MRPEVIITGVGVTSAIGQGAQAFSRALFEAPNAFGVMQRPGRQKASNFLGAEIPSMGMPPGISPQHLRNASLTAQAGLVTLHEAWSDARLSDADPTRIGLIIGGSNLQQRSQVQTYEAYSERTQFLRPTYGLSFMDTDLCGLCTEQFGIQGLAYTVGGASASGQLAIIQAMQAVLCEQVDICIALGALMDLSHWECQGFRSLGAMGSDRYASEPQHASRPFDRDHDGFIYGECCGAVVIERADARPRSGMTPYARVSGWGVAIDANRNPNPSLEGEIKVIVSALRRAGCASKDIDYVNPHGTGSVVGDETELSALRATQLTQARLNATKSIIGHGLSAAGAVEVIATLLQMRAGRLHATRNLDHPIDPSFNWVREQPVAHPMVNALTLSMGFGGINTALCLQKY